MQAIQQSLFLFKREYPLIYARVKQSARRARRSHQGLCGAAISPKMLPLVTDKNKTIPADIQAGLDAYATYYMALAQLEKARLERTTGRPSLAARAYFATRSSSYPSPGSTSLTTRCCAGGPTRTSGGSTRRGKTIPARSRTTPSVDPTTQGHGNLLRARELVLRAPDRRGDGRLPPAPARAGRSGRAGSAPPNLARLAARLPGNERDDSIRRNALDGARRHADLDRQFVSDPR